jgi:hypothetical protein
MSTTRIATAARASTFALLVGAAALGLAGTANATTAAPNPAPKPVVAPVAPVAPGGPAPKPSVAPVAPVTPGGPGGLYGNPTAAAPYWRHQQYDDCAIMSAADVVGQVTGQEPSEQSIIQVAQTTPSTDHPGSIYIEPANPNDPNSGMGTDPADLPTLLAHYGVKAVITDRQDAAKTGVPTGIDALEQDLAQGRKVIAGVNAEMIWGQPVQTKDPQGNPDADHALVVTGVDTNAGIVHLNDSGNPNGQDEQIPLNLFLQSWATSDDQMTVTTS